MTTAPTPAWSICRATPRTTSSPTFPTEKADLIYLCFPNNPTGAVATRAQLEAWVNYAKANDAIILFDAAYEAFIQDPAIPRSIFEIEGARDCAIEFRSFSKNGGFTGVRCAYIVIPKTVSGQVRRPASASRSTSSGAAATAPSSTAPATPSRKPPPPFLPPKANPRSAP